MRRGSAAGSARPMRPECRSACAAWTLALPHATLSGRAGERLGRGTGSSLEFMDFRAYVPGDDLRHVDWRAYARTDQLQVRLFREEVAPTFEIVADRSPSMASTPGKEQAWRDLVEAFAFWAGRAVGRTRRLAMGGEVFEDADTAVLDGSADDLALPRVPLRPRSLRLLLSDFLVPGDPGPVVRRAAAGAAHLTVVQLLDPWEWQPALEGAVTLVDCEGGGRRDLDLDRRAVARYRERLGRLVDGVRGAVEAVGGTYVAVTADAPGTVFRRDLMPAGILEPLP